MFKFILKASGDPLTGGVIVAVAWQDGYDLSPLSLRRHDSQIIL